MCDARPEPPEQTILLSERRQIILNSTAAGNTILRAQRQAGTRIRSQPLTLPANALSGSDGSS